MITQVLQRAGLRTRIEKKGSDVNTIFNKDIQLTRGFRKFFNTPLANAEPPVNPLIKELLMGHTIELDDSYFRPKADMIEQQYRLAMDLITIDPSKRLERKCALLTIEKSKVDEALSAIQDMKAKLGLT